MVSFQPSTVFYKTSLTVTMPAQGEGASSFRLSSVSVIPAPHRPKAELEKIPHSSRSLSISYSTRTGWKTTHSLPLSHL